MVLTARDLNAICRQLVRRADDGDGLLTFVEPPASRSRWKGASNAV